MNTEIKMPPVYRSVTMSTGGHRVDQNDLNFAMGEREFKRFTTLQARAALAGVTLRKRDGASDQAPYIASRMAVTLQFFDIESVDTWLSSSACKPVGWGGT